MLEEQLISYLRTKTGLHVSNEVHAGKRRYEYILVQRTNGGCTNHIRNATYAVQSISYYSKLRAAQINETVKTAMEEFEEASNISACRLNSDYDFTNPNTKEYRYQAVFDIVYY